MSERDDIELLMQRIQEVREAQRQYFNNRNDTNLRHCKALEQALDDLLKQLRRKGYDPDRFKTKTKQGGMF